MRQHALAALIPHPPADRRRGVLDQALADIALAEIDEDPLWGVPSWGDAAPLAVHLPIDERLSLFGDLLAKAAADHEVGPWKLVELGPYLPAELLDQALTVAGMVEHERHRAEVLAALLTHLPAQRRTDVVRAAFAVAYGHAGRYAALAVDVVAAYRQGRDPAGPDLPADRPLTTTTTTLDELDEDEHIDDELDRVERFTQLVAHLPTAQLDQALATAMAFPDDVYRVAALEALAPRLPTPLLDRALAAALTITELDPPMLATTGPASTYGRRSDCGLIDCPISPWAFP
jgi:hypothetical protein